MPKILLPFLLIVSLSGCYSAQQTANDKEDKSKVVTNIISETKIIGEIEFEDESKGLTILVKPVDARKFGKELQSGNYRDGRHKTVFSSVDKADNDDSSDINFDLLINKLLDEGLSINQAQLIIEAIQDEVQANESLFVYGDTEIYFSNDYMANESNPFTLDGRYLSVIEFEIVNSSDETTKICNNDFVLNSENVSYKSIPTKELLSSIPSTTIQYELLHKLLMGECEIIPPNSTITTHLVYPSFYSEEEVTVHYSSQETSLEDQFVIEHNVVRNEYSFSTIKVEGSRNKGYRVIEDPNSSDQVVRASSNNDFYHFIKNYNTLSYIGFNEFFIHDEMDFNSVEIFSVEFQNSEDVSISRTPITKEDLTKGSISVE